MAVDTLPEAIPDVWAFGATPKHADELLELVLAGTKTGTASSLWDYEENGENLPQGGDMSVILDGAGMPRAVIETYDVSIVPFIDVSAEHAYSEGEGDRSLESWRTEHEHYWRTYSESSRCFELTMPIICERFRLIYQTDIAV